MSFKDRLKNLKDHNGAHASLNNEIPNRDLWAKTSILEEKDLVKAEANMKALEEHDSAVVNNREVTSYKRKRAAEYESISDQLDSIYKAMKFLKASGTDLGPEGNSWISKIDAVKTKYPKPQ